MNTILNKQFLIIAVIVLFAALSRLLPHPPNFTPIAALALFGTVYVNDRRVGFALPLAAMLLSDVIIGFHSMMPYIYLSFFLIGLLGLLLKKNLNPMNLIASSLAGSVLFFLISNFAVWAGGGYPQTMAGLVSCYAMAIPFFKNTLMGDLFYCGVMFGGFELSRKYVLKVQ